MLFKSQKPEGPINDFDWLPNGKSFIVNSGHQPAKTESFNNEGVFVKEISVSKTNTLRISPDSRVLCLAGFGNLGGDMEFYNLEDKNLTMIGKTKFYCGVSINWSLDSKFVLVSVLSPRLRVDNEFKVIIVLLIRDIYIQWHFDTE